LILSRRRDERIIINDNIIITVVKIEDGRVRLGISAPKDVRIWREEVLDEMRRNGQQPQEGGAGQ
jgi:carbon storage regulator